MVQRGVLYNNFWEAFKKAYPTRPKFKLQLDLNAEWEQMKKDAVDENALSSAVQKRIQFLQQKATKDKSSNILNFFSKINNESVSHRNEVTPMISSEPDVTQHNSTSLSLPVATQRIDDVNENNEKVSEADTLSRPTPSQDQSKKRIMELTTKISNLVGVRDIGFSNDDTEQQIKKMKKELLAEQIALKKKISDAERKKKSRKNFKLKMKNLCEKYPDMKKDLKFRDGITGRPRIEVDQPDILQAIRKEYIPTQHRMSPEYR